MEDPLSTGPSSDILNDPLAEVRMTSPEVTDPLMEVRARSPEVTDPLMETGVRSPKITDPLMETRVMSQEVRDPLSDPLENQEDQETQGMYIILASGFKIVARRF